MKRKEAKQYQWEAAKWDRELGEEGELEAEELELEVFFTQLAKKQDLSPKYMQTLTHVFAGRKCQDRY